MATESAELIAKLSLDNARFKKQLKEARDKLKEFGDQGEKAGNKAKEGLDGATKSTSVFASAAKNLGSIIGAAFAIDTLIQFGKSVLNTTAQFQKMEAVLTNTLGSSSAAQTAMNQIVEFASQTPFAVEELTNSFVKLANRGIVPTTDQLRSLGDLASSTGKSFDQLTEAALDAMTGEFERLKEFGIRASSEGDKVQFTFKGVTTEVEKTDQAIKDYIISLGDAEGVSGAMTKISTTLGGKLSNLGDNITQLKLAIGNQSSGVFAASIDWLNAFIAKAIMAAKSLRQIREGVISTQGASSTEETRKEVEFLIEKLSKTLPIQDAINRAVDLTKQSYRSLSDDISKGVITSGKLNFTLNQLEKIRIDLLKEQSNQTIELTEEEKRRAEEARKANKEKIKELRAEESAFLKLAKAMPLQRGFIDTDKLKAVKKLTDDIIGKALKPVITQGIIIPQEAIDRIKLAKEEQAQFNKEMSIASTITSMLGDTFQSAFEGMLNTGKVSFKGIIDGLKALVIRLISAAAAAAVLAGILGSIGLGSFTLQGGGFTAGFKTLFKSMSGIPFAEGGMVTGLTSAILGDNPSGKEAIIPFEKMGGFLRQFGTGSENMRVEVVGTIKGQDIYLSGSNYSQRRNKILGV